MAAARRQDPFPRLGVVSSTRSDDEPSESWLVARISRIELDSNLGFECRPTKGRTDDPPHCPCRRNRLTCPRPDLSPIALADRGGNGNGNGKPEASDAWVSVSPNPASAAARVYLEGCGYDVEPVQIRVVDTTGETETYGAGVYNTGCFGVWLHCG